MTRSGLLTGLQTVRPAEPAAMDELLLTRPPLRRIYRWEFPARFAAEGLCAQDPWTCRFRPQFISMDAVVAIETSMDSQNSQPPVSDPDAARSAEALRELHERAQAAIAARRDHASRLEADITTRLEGIAASLAEQEASEGASADQPDETRAEIARLATELEDAQAASQLERAAWESEAQGAGKTAGHRGSRPDEFPSRAAGMGNRTIHICVARGRVGRGTNRTGRRSCCMGYRADRLAGRAQRADRQGDRAGSRSAIIARRTADVAG